MLCCPLQAKQGPASTDHMLGGGPDLVPISSLATALARKFLAFSGIRPSAFPTHYIRHLTEFQNHSHEGNFKENIIQFPLFYSEAPTSPTQRWALGQKGYVIYQKSRI